MLAQTLRAATAADSSALSAPAWAPRSALCPAHFSSFWSAGACCRFSFSRVLNCFGGSEGRGSRGLFATIRHDRKKSGGKPPQSKRNSMLTHWYGALTALFAAGVQFVLFLRWLHRRMRNDEITRAFVRDIATNHLPHIYNALQKIAAEQGIELDETPMVRFVDLNGNRRSR